MSVRPILVCTDPMLRKPSTEIADPTAPEIRALAADMIETMRAAKGAGLAAVQVAEPVRMLVTGNFVPGSQTGVVYAGVGGERVYINPQITEASPEMTEFEEGCLSMPGVFFKVMRHKAITVLYTKPDGAVHEERFTDFAAICLQHEIDHLNGIRNVDRVSSLKRGMLIKKMETLRRERERAAARPREPARQATM